MCIEATKRGRLPQGERPCTCMPYPVYEPPPPQIYDILECEADGTEASRSLDAVIRVASPAFPGDKMRSEVRQLINNEGQICTF